jgi:hypothetical protein
MTRAVNIVNVVNFATDYSPYRAFMCERFDFTPFTKLR